MLLLSTLLQISTTYYQLHCCAFGKKQNQNPDEYLKSRRHRFYESSPQISGLFINGQKEKERKKKSCVACCQPSVE